MTMTMVTTRSGSQFVRLTVRATSTRGTSKPCIRFKTCTIFWLGQAHPPSSLPPPPPEPAAAAADAAAFAATATKTSSNNDNRRESLLWRTLLVTTAASLSGALVKVPDWNLPSISYCHDDDSGNKNGTTVRDRLAVYLQTVSIDNVIDDDDDDLQQLDDLPVYTSAQVQQHNGLDDDNNNNNNNNDSSHKGDTTTNKATIWMSYGGKVYDVTELVLANVHPGGSQRLERAAGQPLELYWSFHTQHFQSLVPLQILNALPVVGKLATEDQQRIDDQVEQLQMDTQNFVLTLDLSEVRNYCAGHDSDDDDVVKGIQRLSLMDLKKKYRRTDRTSLVGCPRNQDRRPVSTQLFSGVTLGELLSPQKNTATSTPMKVVGVTFFALDGETVSIPIGTGGNDDADNDDKHIPYQDILLCFEMDGALLTRERGFPIRVIIPGRRAVKWVEKILIHASSENDTNDARAK